MKSLGNTFARASIRQSLQPFHVVQLGGYLVQKRVPSTSLSVSVYLAIAGSCDVADSSCHTASVIAPLLSSSVFVSKSGQRLLVVFSCATVDFPRRKASPVEKNSSLDQEGFILRRAAPLCIVDGVRGEFRSLHGQSKGAEEKSENSSSAHGHREPLGNRGHPRKRLLLKAMPEVSPPLALLSKSSAKSSHSAAIRRNCSACCPSASVASIL